MIKFLRTNKLKKSKLQPTYKSRCVLPPKSQFIHKPQTDPIISNYRPECRQFRPQVNQDYLSIQQNYRRTHSQHDRHNPICAIPIQTPSSAIRRDNQTPITYPPDKSSCRTWSKSEKDDAESLYQETKNWTETTVKLNQKHGQERSTTAVKAQVQAIQRKRQKHEEERNTTFVKTQVQVIKPKSQNAREAESKREKLAKKLESEWTKETGGYKGLHYDGDSSQAKEKLRGSSLITRVLYGQQ